MSSYSRVWLTTFTVTTEDGEEKTFEGPHIFAFNYNEAKSEAELLSKSAVAINREIKIEIIGELNEETQLPIIH
jgi:hypothetical protein